MTKDIELNPRTIVNSLLAPSSLEQTVHTLGRVVLDLMMEVEGLRRALLMRESPGRTDFGFDNLIPEGISPGYGRAYWGSALLTHNNAGPSFGLEKLAAAFYPEGPELRELQMLRCLGLSDREIETYKRAALDAEAFT